MEKKYEEELEKIVNEEVDNFFRTFEETNDHVIKVLKFHLLIENMLERIILAKLKRGDIIIDNGNFSFYQKLCLVNSFEIFEDCTVQSIKKLNSLRNQCAHDRGKVIKDCDIELIGRPFGKGFRDVKRKSSGVIERFIILTFGEVFKHVIKCVTASEHADYFKELAIKQSQA